MSVHPDGDAKGPGETKVGKLDDTISVNQEVLRLQVSMQYPPFVAEQNALQNLVQVTLQTQWPANV